MNMKNKELRVTIAFIVTYVVGMSYADILSGRIGVNKSITFPFSLILTIFLLLYINKRGLSSRYGLKKVEGKSKTYLWFIPLVMIASVNIWFGIIMNMSVMESIFYFFTMIGAGIIEEILFRGMLYKTMAENNEKSAIVLSSLLFGIGHLVNLINGSGAELVSNICQVLYAFSVGFMFVILFRKSGSIIPGIITHSILNALSTFNNEALAIKYEIPVSIFLIVLSLLYSVFLMNDKAK